MNKNKNDIDKKKGTIYKEKKLDTPGVFIARAVTIAPWVADFVKEEGAVTADETDAQELFMH